MRIVVLGLSLSSSWGNGHATTYRALLRAFAARGHDVLFLERDVAWYAPHRDLVEADFCRLELYPKVASLERWRGEIEAADAVIVGSYVPDGAAVGDWVLRHASGVRAFYDIDTPITLAGLEDNSVAYLRSEQIARYDLYLSFTGGPTLDLLTTRFGAPCARALYCSVDPLVYRPTGQPRRWDCSYLGTYSQDRQPVLETLLLEPARRAPELRFAVAGPQYPADIAWPANVTRIEHLPPHEHADFYGASRFTLNVTRAAMAAAGYSPSVRLFEAAACGTAILSDDWPGLQTIFGPGALAVADCADGVLQWLRLPDDQRVAMEQKALAAILARHTAAHRATELERFLIEAAGTARRIPPATSDRARAYAVP